MTLYTLSCEAELTALHYVLGLCRMIGLWVHVAYSTPLRGVKADSQSIRETQGKHRAAIRESDMQ